MNTEMQPETLSVEQARKVLGLSKNSIYNAIHAGEIPSIKIGGKILVPRRQLERLLAGEKLSA